MRVSDFLKWLCTRKIYNMKRALYYKPHAVERHFWKGYWVI
ncbi:MAG: hypothetical protein ACI91R_001581, partial [Vicingaceae bacterium]